MAAELELSDELGLTGITLEAQGLLRLDAIWTRWLARPELDKTERIELADVGTLMERILSAMVLPDRLAAVEKAATVRSEAAAATMRSVFEGNPTLQVGPARNLASPEGFEEFVRQRLSELAGAAPEALRELSGKAARLRDGEWVPGDFPVQMLCLLLSLVLGNSAMLALTDRDAWYGTVVGALKDAAGFGCGFLQ